MKIAFPSTRRQQQLGIHPPAQKQLNERLIKQQREQERRNANKKPGEWP